MYTVITRRRISRERQPETLERARNEFFPKMQSAPGFVSFYLIRDEEESLNTAISVWDSKESAAAFQPQLDAWFRVLEELGNTLESVNRGDTVVSLEANR
jgi:heme-degrading monooxygenase HmoA